MTTVLLLILGLSVECLLMLFVVIDLRARVEALESKPEKTRSEIADEVIAERQKAQQDRQKELYGAYELGRDLSAIAGDKYPYNLVTRCEEIND